MRVYTGGVEERKTATDMAPPHPPVLADQMPTTMTSSGSKVEEAGRLPSIEMEPKTLTLDQIKYAREAALYVVSTKTEEEAIRIFTAGLKPVRMNDGSSNGARSCTNKSGGSMDSSSDDDVDLGCCGGSSHGGGGSSTCGRDHGKGGGGAGAAAGRRRRGRRQQHHSIDDDIRDVATAPF